MKLLLLKLLKRMLSYRQFKAALNERIYQRRVPSIRYSLMICIITLIYYHLHCWCHTDEIQKVHMYWWRKLGGKSKLFYTIRGYAKWGHNLSKLIHHELVLNSKPQLISGYCFSSKRERILNIENTVRLNYEALF